MSGRQGKHKVGKKHVGLYASKAFVDYMNALALKCGMNKTELIVKAVCGYGALMGHKPSDDAEGNR